MLLNFSNVVDIFPFLLFSSMLALNILRLKRFIALSNFIWGLYAASMLAYAINTIVFEKEYYYSFKALFLILTTNSILLLPLYNFERNITKNTQLSELNLQKIKVLTSFLIAISIYSILFYSVYMVDVFNYGIMEVRRDRVVFFERSILSKLAVSGAFLFPISLFFFFYSLIKFGFTLRSKLILFSSFSFIFLTLNAAARDGIVIWLLCFTSLYCLFYPMIINRYRRSIVFIFITFLGMVIPIFAVATMSRFGSGGIGGAIESIFNYSGMQLHELSYMLDELHDFNIKVSPERIFSVFYMFLEATGLPIDIQTRFDRILEHLASGYQSNVFSYYIGNLYLSIRLVGTILLIMFFFVVYKTNLRFISGAILTSRLLIAFSWYMIIIVGVFYFYYGELAGNYFLISPFVIFIFLNLSFRQFSFGHKADTKSSNTSNSIQASSR